MRTLLREHARDALASYHRCRQLDTWLSESHPAPRGAVAAGPNAGKKRKREIRSEDASRGASRSAASARRRS